MDKDFDNAQACIRDFINTHPEYKLLVHTKLPQGNNNRVLRGTWQDQPILFKYYGDSGAHAGSAKMRKQREQHALTHFAQTKCVPQIIDASHSSLLVMSFIQGDTLENVLPNLWHTSSSKNDIQNLSTQFGKAFATLTNTPLHQTKKERQDHLASLEHFVYDTLNRSQKLYYAFSAYKDTLFSQSLTLIENTLPNVLTQTPILYTEDHNPGNSIVKDTKFCAFIDLELYRIGTEALQLGAVFDCLCAVPERLIWENLLVGYEATAQRPQTTDQLKTILAMAHFNIWLRASGPDLSHKTQNQSTLSEQAETYANTVRRRLTWCNNAFPNATDFF